jgi:hypothetical protein
MAATEFDVWFTGLTAEDAVAGMVWDNEDAAKESAYDNGSGWAVYRVTVSVDPAALVEVYREDEDEEEER